MKNRKFLIVASFFLLVFAVFFTSANGNNTVYRIWVNNFNFSVKDADFGTLNDGNFMGVKLSGKDFEWEKTNNYKNITSYDFTEDQLFSFFKGKGFGDAEARESVNWLTSVNHALLGARQGNFLYIILK